MYVTWRHLQVGRSIITPILRPGRLNWACFMNGSHRIETERPAHPPPSPCPAPCPWRRSSHPHPWAGSTTPRRWPAHAQQPALAAGGRDPPGAPGPGPPARCFSKIPPPLVPVYVGPSPVYVVPWQNERLQNFFGVAHGSPLDGGDVGGVDCGSGFQTRAVRSMVRGMGFRWIAGRDRREA